MCTNTDVTLMFICLYKINKSDLQQEIKLMQIGLSRTQRALYISPEPHIHTYMTVWDLSYVFNFYWTITRTTY